jgi:pterin-4a-carbinolamine dehydratase
MDWLNQKIKETEKWLSQNQRQASLPTMEIEDALHKQEVSHKREILSLLHQFRHHPNAKLHYEDVCSTPKTNYPQGL